VIEETRSTFLDYQRFVDAGTVSVTGNYGLGTVELKQDVFVVVNVTCGCGSNGDNFLFYSSA
jgi:hypothetical protein